MLEEKLKAEANRLGFSLSGITSPSRPPHLDTYHDWLAGGYHAEMKYLATERARLCREDLRHLMPEVQSILVVAWPYPPVPTIVDPHRGSIAAYALNQDYHEVIPQRLEALAHWLQQETGQTTLARWYTDTGPILERDLAQQAGLGWIGKNTCLIHPQQGSYFFLAELLLNIALQPDEPFSADRCGTCQRCIQACPTGCIQPNRTLDARRCVSYLTIENKGAIPRELRSHVGNHLFGCDICQQVCPWNHQLLAEAQKTVGVIDLIQEIQISAQEFNHRFRGSPISRAKRRGYLRNIAVTMGNSRDTGYLPVLRKTLLEETEPLVRAHAAWAMGQIGTDLAIDTLSTALQHESDATVRQEIILALKA